MPVRIVSYRYDRSLRDEMQAELLEHSGNAIRLYVSAGTTIDIRSEGRTVPATDSATEIFFTDRWYNVRHFHKVLPPHNNLWYANVAMPAEFDGSTLSWVDLDIDVLCHRNGAISIADEDDFESHAKQWNYPEDLVTKAYQARDEILRLASSGAFPFDRHRQVQDGPKLGISITL